MSTDTAPAPALERNWWVRALAVLVAPRAVFASLRDESDESAEERQDPLTAIAALAGISVVLVSPTFRRMLNDGDVSLVNWGFNGWAKYSNFELDQKIGSAIAKLLFDLLWLI